MDPRAGLDDLEKRKLLALPGLELRPLDRSACSQSLYRLRYPGSEFHKRQGISSPAEQLLPTQDGERAVEFICLILLCSDFYILYSR
jgi:hypothetical protein